MKTQIGSNTFITHFAYPEFEREFTRSYGTEVVTQRESICKIKLSVSATDSKVIAEAKVRTDSREQFVKAIGRNMAFKKALAALFASKENREKYGLSSADFNTFMKDFNEQCPSNAKVFA
jgi:hypothetical protein